MLYRVEQYAVVGWKRMREERGANMFYTDTAQSKQ